MMSSKLWFKQKRYGWGWTPGSWEGGVVTLFYGLAVLLWSVWFDELSMWWFLGLLGLVASLIGVCYWKGEKPRWRWGE